MGLITAGMGVVLKHIKKPGQVITKAGDKWMAKTKKLQHSKKKIEKIRGAARVIGPMTVSALAGARMGIKDAEAEKKRLTHAAGQRPPPKSLYKDIKKVIKKVTKK